MAEACPRCGVRGDIGCPHQPAEGPPPPAVAKPTKPKRSSLSGGGRYKIISSGDGQGLNFRAKKRD